MLTPLFASLVLALAPALAQVPSPGPALRPAVAEAVATLAAYKSIESSHIGAGGVPSVVYAAFEKVRKLASPAEFHALLRHPSPTVRGYVARALIETGSFDQAELVELARDKTQVRTLEGCMRFESSIGDLIYDAARWAPADNKAAHALADTLAKTRAH